MLVGRRRFVVGLSAAMVVGLLSVVAAPVALAETIYVADMTGDQEVPGPGDPDGTGYAELRIDPGSGQVCAFISVADVSEPTAAHIHTGDAGVAGGIVVTLPTPTGGEVDDCVSGLDAGVLQAIVDDPASYYVNVHTADFPAGALRGQLAALDITRVNVYKAVCPPEIQTPADLDQGGAETCVPAWRTGDLDLPAGYTWEIEPVEFDMDIEVVDDSGSLTIADAELEGGASCSSITMTCTGRRGYGFYPIVQGPVSVTQLSTPAGYRFGWAIASSAVEGEAAPPFDVDVDGASITLDSTGFDQAVSVTIYDFAGAQAAESTIFIRKFACPEGISSPEELADAGGTDACRPAVGPGRVPPAPAGYTYDPEPLVFDMDLLIESGASSFDLADGTSGGDGSCDPSTLTCTANGAYEFDGVPTGETTITQTTFPDGYVFGWAEATLLDGSPFAGLVNDATNSRAVVDTTGATQAVIVSIFDIVPSQEPAPSVTITPPPTSTAGVPRSTPSFLPLTLIAALLSTVGFVAFGARRARARRHQGG